MIQQSAAGWDSVRSQSSEQEQLEMVRLRSSLASPAPFLPQLSKFKKRELTLLGAVTAER
jgi:hypothetical protein